MFTYTLHVYSATHLVFFLMSILCIVILFFHRTSLPHFPFLPMCFLEVLGELYLQSLRTMLLLLMLWYVPFKIKSFMPPQ